MLVVVVVAILLLVETKFDSTQWTDPQFPLGCRVQFDVSVRGGHPLTLKPCLHPAGLGTESVLVSLCSTKVFGNVTKWFYFSLLEDDLSKTQNISH